MVKSAFYTTLMVGLLAVGCASKKPANTQDDGAVGATDTSKNSGLNLDLNGDSDSKTAGGLQTVFFAVDSSNFDSEGKEALKTNADFMKSNATVDIQVEGHADERGGRQYNLALGERRAKAVRDYLVALGVESKRLSVISYGNERPKAEGHDESSWSQNRRANFVITAK